MAQLRDKQTSELIAEGTPLAVALLADTIGRREVIFDDVGEGFDPRAVLDAERARLEALEAAASEAEGADRQRLEEATEEQRAALTCEPPVADRTTEAMRRARKRSDQARDAD